MKSLIDVRTLKMIHPQLTIRLTRQARSKEVQVPKVSQKQVRCLFAGPVEASSLVRLPPLSIPGGEPHGPDSSGRASEHCMVLHLSVRLLDLGRLYGRMRASAMAR